MARLGRPKNQCSRTANFKVTEQEWQDLRKCAIAEGITMVDFLRQAIKRCKRKHQTAGTWPETAERE